ncbi:MAG: rhamnogalacturonan acetylesterase [Brevundimonas sp.]|nr:MAG: rhamnogalacturonan acetylesterase [Brevundimonas sp.]
MKLSVLTLALAALSGPALAQTPAQTPTPAAQPIRASKIILVGDSTTQVTSGWGGSFCNRHVTSFVACVNMARGGRSTGSYIAEGSWDLALGEMSTPGFVATYVLIQFGHNDQPGKPGRSTDLATEFPANLRRYVEETRARGAIPVLLTPLTRRQFIDGALQNDLEPWAQTIRQVAAETDTPLVDLNADSVAAVQALGPVLSAHFAQVAPSSDVAAALFTGTTIAAATGAPQAPAPAAATAPAATATASPQIQAAANAAAEPLGQARLAFDYTHLGAEGADFFSAMVTRGLITAVPALRRNLVP